LPRTRLQTELMFVARENLDRPFGMFRGFLGDGIRRLFLNAAAFSGIYGA
jgi:hypothetical protein